MTAKRPASPICRAPKNGRLLEAAEAAGFDVVITVDQNIPDQQNLAGRWISLVILCGPTNGCAIWSYWCPPRFPRYVQSVPAIW